MIAVRPFDPADAGRWDAYVLSHPDSHFGQCAAWRALTASQYGVEPRYWVAVAGERVHGVLPLFESARALFSAPGGLLADDEAVAAALLEPARRRLVDAALDWIELRDQRRAWPHLETSGEHVTLELALERDPDRQWATFDAKLRNQIRKGERAGFEPRWGRDQVAAFHRVLLENMRDLGTPIRSEGYYRAALGALGDAADLLVLWQGRTPVGAMFVVEHRDAMVDYARDSLDIVAPAGDLITIDAYDRLTADATSGFVVGKSVVDGVRCDHLAFRSGAVDWQIWIEDGDKPLPRKYVITSLDIPQAPQFAQVMSNWSTDTAFKAEHFEFTPPSGSRAIRFLPVGAAGAQP